jgi:hypothetical protein
VPNSDLADQQRHGIPDAAPASILCRREMRLGNIGTFTVRSELLDPEVMMKSGGVVSPPMADMGQSEKIRAHRALSACVGQMRKATEMSAPWNVETFGTPEKRSALVHAFRDVADQR